MKKVKLFVMLLVGVLCLASCNKEEGSDPETPTISEQNSMFTCRMTGDANYAVYEVKVIPDSLHLSQLQVSKLWLSYQKVGSLVEDTVVLLKNTLITNTFNKKDTIWGLEQGASYKYCAHMEDLVQTRHTAEAILQMPQLWKMVWIDTAFFFGNRMSFVASAVHDLPRQDAQKLNLSIWWGYSENQLDNRIDSCAALVDSVVMDSVWYVSYTASGTFNNDETLWYQAVVTDALGYVKKSPVIKKED